MKIFGIYSKVELIHKPEWLDTFRETYDKPYEYHVTLMQARYISEDDIAEIKEKLSALFSKKLYHEMRLEFDRITGGSAPNDEGCIMINTTDNHPIHDLQKNIIAELANDYQSYVTPESQEWEQSFKPHITIARDLSPERYTAAMNSIKKDFRCMGMIHEVILVIVEHAIPDESNNPQNQTPYPLEP